MPWVISGHRGDGQNNFKLRLMPGKDVVIGRSSTSPIPMGSLHISRQHLKISSGNDGEGWLLQDLASANGTVLNNKRLGPNKKALLKCNDIIKCGLLLEKEGFYEMTVSYEEDEEAKPKKKIRKKPQETKRYADLISSDDESFSGDELQVTKPKKKTNSELISSDDEVEFIEEFDPKKPLTIAQLKRLLPPEVLKKAIKDPKLLSRPYVHITEVDMWGKGHKKADDDDMVWSDSDTKMSNVKMKSNTVFVNSLKDDKSKIKKVQPVKPYSRDNDLQSERKKRSPSPQRKKSRVDSPSNPSRSANNVKKESKDSISQKRKRSPEIKISRDENNRGNRDDKSKVIKSKSEKEKISTKNSVSEKEKRKASESALPLSLKQKMEAKERTSALSNFTDRKMQVIDMIDKKGKVVRTAPKEQRTRQPIIEPVIPVKPRVSHMKESTSTRQPIPSTSTKDDEPKKPVHALVNPLLKDCAKDPAPPPIAAVNAVKNIRPSVQERITADPYLADMLSWNPKWLDEVDVCKEPPPLYPKGLLPVMKFYENIEHFAAVLIPYTIYEIWENCLESYRVLKKKHHHSSDHKIDAFCMSYESTLTFMSLKLDYPQTQTDRLHKQIPREGDFVTLDITIDPATNELGPSPDDHVFGYIYGSSEHSSRHSSNKPYHLPNGCNSVITYTVVIRKKPIRINQNKPVRILRLEYIKPAIRHMEAVLNLKKSFLLNDILNPKKMTCQMAFPTVTDLSTHPEYNLSQYQAILGVAEALRRPQKIPKIQLIQGPPGTGKTHTVVGILKEIYINWTPWQSDKLPKILVCAPSNGAVDEIGKRIYAARHFMQPMKKRSLRVVRVGNEDKNLDPEVRKFSLDYLVETNRSMDEAKECFEMKIGDLEKKLAAVDVEISNLRFKKDLDGVRLKESEMNYMMQDMDRLRRQKQEEDSKDARAAMANNTTTQEVKKRSCRDTILKKADVILVTLNSCRKSVLEAVFNSPKSEACFNCVIVDEAAQCSEPELLMPLYYTSISKMVLIGDPLQLPATIKSPISSDAGYGRSLFERFYHHFKDTPDNPIHMLNIQYRMHKEICLFPGKKFYQGKLQSHPTAGIIPSSGDHWYPFHPYTVIDVQGTSHSSTKRSKSLENVEEAVFIVQLLKTMKTHLKNRTSVGVVTPYSGQKHLLDQKIKKEVSGFTIEVNTIDGFQGQERDIIIFSSVRSDEDEKSRRVGFLSSEQRLNVALTRAKYCLVICVSRKTLEKNELWKDLLDDANSRRRLFPLTSNSSLKQIANVVVTSEVKRDVPMVTCD